MADHRRREACGDAETGSEIPGHTHMAVSVGPVAQHVEVVDHFLGDAESLAVGHPERGVVGQQHDPAVVVAEAQFAAPSTACPRWLIPRIGLGSIALPSGITVPGVASGTTSPALMLNAPHHTCRSTPSPAST